MLQDALSEVTIISLRQKLRSFVDDVTALLMARNREVAEIGKEGDGGAKKRS